MKKVIFIDIDGTLMFTDQTIPDSAFIALEKAKQKGADIFIATGRTINEVSNEILSLNIDGFITSNGSNINYKGKIIKEATFSRNEVKRILSFFELHKISYYVGTKYGLYSPKSSVAKIVKVWEENAKELNTLNKFPIDFYEILTKYDFSDVSFHQINKFVFLSRDVKFAEVYAEFSNDFEVLHRTVHEFGDFSGEIILKHADKGAAVKEILNKYDEPIVSYAFGDGSNDKTMLETVDKGIKMAVSHKDLNNVATHTALPIEDDGIYKVFKFLELI